VNVSIVFDFIVQHKHFCSNNGNKYYAHSFGLETSQLWSLCLKLSN